MNIGFTPSFQKTKSKGIHLFLPGPKCSTSALSCPTWPHMMFQMVLRQCLGLFNDYRSNSALKRPKHQQRTIKNIFLGQDGQLKPDTGFYPFPFPSNVDVSLSYLSHFFNKLNYIRETICTKKILCMGHCPSHMEEGLSNQKIQIKQVLGYVVVPRVCINITWKQTNFPTEEGRTIVLQTDYNISSYSSKCLEYLTMENIYLFRFWKK